MTASANTLTTAFTGMLPFIILVAATVTPLLAYLLLRLYRRSVLRAMSRSSGNIPECVTERPLTAHTATPATQPLHVSFRTAGAVPDAGPPPIARRVTAVYALAGGVFALVMTVATLASAGFEFYPVRLGLVFLVYLWPVFLILYLDGSTTGRSQLLLFGIYLCVMVALSAVALARSPDLTIAQLATLWLTMNAPAAVITLAFTWQPVRAIGPLVILFLLVFISGAVLLLAVVGAHDDSLRLAANAGAALGLGAGGTYAGIALSGLLLAAFIGWWLLIRVRRAYTAKRINDKSIAVDAVYLLLGTIHSISLAFEGLAWIATGLLAFAAYEATLRFGLRLHPVDTDNTPTSSRLLLLRVFALGKRSQQLFHAVTRSWRYRGPIQLIAGPDLATTTIDPQEFLEFVSGRLDSLFIGDEPSLARALEQLDNAPDFDYRYRVNEFFCHENIWRLALSRLVENSDVVLMDLRAFSPDNAGCIFELNELVARVPLARVVLATDETTDRAFLERTLTQAWQQLGEDSPNANLERPDIQVVCFEGFSEPQLRGLMGALQVASV